VDNNNAQNKRRIFILVSAIDAALSGIVLLIYFGFFPFDLSSLGIPRGVIGIIAGIWFASALAVLVYQLTKTDSIE
jgi:hypothetical protein